MTPVVEMEDAHRHPHNQARGSFALNCRGEMDPVPAPRLSGHEGEWSDPVGRPEPGVGQHTEEVLKEAGFSGEEVEKLIGEGVVEQGEAMTKSKL